MAYNHRFNPDALPAHAEPNEAAQMIANAQGASHRPSIPSQPSYLNKPPPPLPSDAQQSSSSSSYRPQRVGNISPVNAQTPYLPHIANIPGHVSHNLAWPAGINTGPHTPGGYPNSPGNNQPSSPLQQQYQQPQQPQQHQHQQQQQQQSLATQRPHSPLPPAGTPDPSLWPLFMTVDTKRTGQLGQAELSSALKNDEYTSFDGETVRLMIKMFDGNGNGSIGYEEFCGLWGFLGAWRGLFQRFDEDKSGSISFREYKNALVAFGYSLSDDFVNMMYRLYDRRGGERMTFDLFVQSCIQLKRMTDVFKRYDTDRDGFVTLSFEDFLSEILITR